MWSLTVPADRRHEPEDADEHEDRNEDRRLNLVDPVHRTSLVFE
jgi:hypothetical protein